MADPSENSTEERTLKQRNGDGGPEEVAKFVSEPTKRPQNCGAG